MGAELTPIACHFCKATPRVAELTVSYHSPRREGPQTVYRAQCGCGAHGKCRPDHAAAIEAWNEPWQALPPPPDPFRHEPETCGTHHLAAERALRILENPLLEQIDAPTIEALRELVGEAGIAFARSKLTRDEYGEFPF